MSHKRSDFLIQQQVFLGGQVSQKLAVFKEIARMSPDYATGYLFLDKLPDFEKITDDRELAKKVLELLGEIDLMRGFTEITRLSMILGDPRGRYSVKGVMDELRKTESNRST